MIYDKKAHCIANQWKTVLLQIIFSTEQCLINGINNKRDPFSVYDQQYSDQSFSRDQYNMITDTLSVGKIIKQVCDNSQQSSSLEFWNGVQQMAKPSQ